MVALILTKKVLLYLCTLPHIHGIRPGGCKQGLNRAFEAPSSLGNSFLSHNYPAAILSTVVVLKFEKRNEKK